MPQQSSVYPNAKALTYQPLSRGSQHLTEGIPNPDTLKQRVADVKAGEAMFDQLKSELRADQVLYACYVYGSNESGLFIYEGKDLYSRTRPAMGAAVVFYAVKESEM